MTILEDIFLSITVFDTVNHRTIYCAFIIVVVTTMGCYFVLIRQIYRKKNNEHNNQQMKESKFSSSSTKSESMRVYGPICPFSAETSFVVETAEHLPPTPLDLHDSWLLEKSKPLAARWLNAGISGQDTPGMLRAGLKRMRNSEHFLVEERNVREELMMKSRAMDDRNEMVFVAEPDSVAAQDESLELLLTFLPKKYPELYVYDRRLQTIYVRPIDTTFRLSEWKHRPLELCGRIVQEDLILMRPSDKSKQYAMAAACVVFSFDGLKEKLGKPVSFLHAPVPGFEKHIRKTVDLTFDRLLKVEAPMWRNNWGLSRSGEIDKPLYGAYRAELEHVNRAALITTTEHVRNSFFLKVEYQTIRRLPTSKYLLFTVKTMVDPLSSLEEAPLAAQCLAASIRGMSSAMRLYKGIPDDSTCDVILKYLDSLGCTQ